MEKIQVRLDKVMNEPMNFGSVAGNDTQMAAEESRLLSFANSAKTEIGDIVTELDRAAESKELTDNAKKLTDAFFNSYKLKVAYDKATAFYTDRNNGAESGKMRVGSLNAYNKMLEIKQTFNE